MQILMERHALAADAGVARRFLFHVHRLDDHRRAAKELGCTSGHVGMPGEAAPLRVVDVMSQVLPPACGFGLGLVGHKAVDFFVSQQIGDDDVSVAAVVLDVLGGERGY